MIIFIIQIKQCLLLLFNLYIHNNHHSYFYILGICHNLNLILLFSNHCYKNIIYYLHLLYSNYQFLQNLNQYYLNQYLYFKSFILFSIILIFIILFIQFFIFNFFNYLILCFSEIRKNNHKMYLLIILKRQIDESPLLM